MAKINITWVKVYDIANIDTSIDIVNTENQNNGNGQISMWQPCPVNKGKPLTKKERKTKRNKSLQGNSWISR